MQVDNTIVLKIKKLLEMANSSNRNEAEIASAKAQELLVKYNLEIQQVESIETDYNEEDLIQYKRVMIEVREVALILVRHFFVRVLFDSKRYSNVKTTTVRTFGKNSNVKIASYVYTFLIRTYRNLWKEYKKKNKRANKKYFFKGITQGLSMKLTETKYKVEKEYGLIVKEDSVLLNWSSKYDIYKDKTTIKVTSKSFIHGYKEGRNIEIKKPITSERKDGGGYIGN